MQQLCYTGILLVVVAFGCSNSLPPDSYGVGPVPATSDRTSLTRERVYVEAENWLLGGAWHTRWNLNSTMVHPKQCLVDLKIRIPSSLQDRLAETFKKRNGPNTREFDCHKNFAHACLVSLDPDVLVFTVRSHVPPSTSPHLFPESQIGAPDWRGIRKKYELIDSDGITLIYFSGQTCLWSSDMYVLSTNETIGFQALKFVNGVSKVQFDSGEIILTKDGGWVNVRRKHPTAGA